VQSSKDYSGICAFCEKQAAVEAYTRAGRTEMVCASCGDRCRVQDAFEDKAIHLANLQSARKYDEAIACLDSIFESNRDRDHDGWLARSIAAHRAMIFMDAGRYADAEQAWNTMAEVGFADVFDRWEYAVGAARVWDAQGRTQEAAALLEDTLRYPIPSHYLPSARAPLGELARISEKLAQPLDPKYLRLAKAIAKRFGIDMPANESVAKAILALRETIRSTKAEPLQEKDEGEQALFSFE
jgi:tetratricopeptide (TPR) repeat protein